MSLLLGALAVHLLPNAVMKKVKTSKFGHKLLTSTFEIGLEGKELSKMSKDILTYVVGPESLVEYQMGLKVFNYFKDELGEEVAKLYIKGLAVRLKENFNNLSQEEIERMKNVPFVNTLLIHCTEDVSDVKGKIENYLTNGSKEGSVVNYFTYGAIATTAFAIDQAALFQPAFCYVRKKIGTSKSGKKFLMNNFDKGYEEGKGFSRIREIATDYFIAPSVLDTQRLGLFLNDYKDDNRVDTIVQVVKIALNEEK